MEYLISLILFSIIPVAILYKRRYLLKHVLKGMAIALGVGTVWDYVAISRGWWAYGEKFILGPKLFGIPLEDFLFFVVVPAAVVSIHDVISRR